MIIRGAKPDELELLSKLMKLVIPAVVLLANVRLPIPETAGVVVPIPTVPVLVTANRVVVAVPLVEEEMIKANGLLMLVEARESARVAIGEVVPMPTLPSKVVVERREVEEAKRPWVNQIGVEVEFAVAPKFWVVVKGKAAVRPEPVT